MAGGSCFIQVLIPVQTICASFDKGSVTLVKFISEALRVDISLQAK